ncbi:MAG: hypothetical protein HZA10_09300 [Nitrospirae bacterium]|nr:hypothetical protein [Nitrospirota bacterium]
MNTNRERRKEAKAEKTQQKLDAGFISTHFPEVANIVISMRYTQSGTKLLLRTVNFAPGSAAFFKLDCLGKECIDGGFDLKQVITAMIRNHNAAAKGELNCGSSGSCKDHAAIVYDVAIKYI